MAIAMTSGIRRICQMYTGRPDSGSRSPPYRSDGDAETPRSMTGALICERWEVS